jgi:hypothetical protein
LKFSEADYKVDAFLNWIDEMVRKRHRELQVGMLPRDVQQDWNEYAAPKRCWHVDAKPTDRTMEFRPERGFCRGNFVEGGGARGEVGFAIGCEGNAPGSAMEELSAQALLQLRNRLSNSGLCQTELLGGVRETA